MHHVAKRRRTDNNVNERNVPNSVDLAVCGEECKLQRSNYSSHELIRLSRNSWNEDFTERSCGDNGRVDLRSQSSSSLLADRYDARTLMDGLSLQQLCHQRAKTVFHTDGVIDKKCVSQSIVMEEGSQEEIDQRNTERYGMLSNAYKTSRCGVGKSDSKVNEKPFEPTEEQRRSLPRDIMLPSSLKHHNIIELTAARVTNNPQLEVFLKMKQSNNQHLSFIYPGDLLYPYYVHVRDEKRMKANQASKKAELPDGDSNSGLNGLLAGYDSSCSSNDEEDTEIIEESAAASASKCSVSVSKRREERLERLREWKKTKNF